MKALSLWQPWASLWATADAKIHETRSWPTKHRGELALHASKQKVDPLTFPLAEMTVMDRLLGIMRVADWDAMPRGAIIAVITIEDCRLTDSGTAHDLDRMFGNWTPGRFAWRRGPVIHKLAQPVPCRGYQGIWNLDKAIEAQVREQLPRKCECVGVEIGSHTRQTSPLPVPAHMRGLKLGCYEMRATISVDLCIEVELRTLWIAGIATTGSCCGHNKVPGYVGVIAEHAARMRDELGYRPYPDHPDHFICKTGTAA